MRTMSLQNNKSSNFDILCRISYMNMETDVTVTLKFFILLIHLKLETLEICEKISMYIFVNIFSHY